MFRRASKVNSAPVNGVSQSLLHNLGWRRRATVLGPLATFLAVILFGGGFLLQSAEAPSWLLVLLVSAAAILFLIFVGAYLFFLFTNPDMLRSEQYLIQKFAIEEGFFGDSTQGLIDVTSGLKQLQDLGNGK